MKFGTDGVRGPADRAPIDVEGAMRIGQAAARWAREGGEHAQVWVARDTRPSGRRLVDGVLQGVRDLGLVAVDVGVLSSPGLAASIAAYPGPVAGVMVTASHNPAPDNGFKVLGPDGHKPTPERTATLERWLARPLTQGDVGAPSDGAAGAMLAYARGFRRAVGDLSALDGRHVAVDLAHGAAVSSVPMLRALLPEVRFTWVGAGDGVINDGVGSQHPQALVAAVKRLGCDAGIAVDGDADRCLLVDNMGAPLPGDTLAWLLAKGLGAERIAVTIMSTLALEASLPGVSVIRTPVGDKHLAAAMADGDVALGAEESGHVLFGGGLPGGDGLLTGLRALAFAWREHTTVGDACAPFSPWPRALTSVEVHARPALDAVPELVAAVADAERALGPGRTLLRYSGTEPILRVLVEGPDGNVVEQVSAELTHACKVWLR